MKKYIMLIISLINTAAMAVFTCFNEAETVPTHFGIDMKPDAYGSKWAMLYMPIVCVILSVVLIIYRKATEKKENVQKNKKYEDITISSLIILFIILGWGIALYATGFFTVTSGEIVPWIALAVGILMVIWSNIMGKLAPNRTFGIKTRGTLKNKTVWRKAHRLGGVLGVIAGFIGIIIGIFTFKFDGYAPYLLAAELIFFIVMFGIIPTVYSEVLYKKLGGDEQ